MKRFYGLTYRQSALSVVISACAGLAGCQATSSGSQPGSERGAAARAASSNGSELNMQKPVAAGTNTLFRHSVTVKAPPERIWSIWMDVANWPTWDTELKQAATDKPLALGVAGKVITKNGTASGFKVVSFMPQMPKPTYAFETLLPSATLTVTRSLVQQGSSTVFTHEVAFGGEKGAFFADQFGPGFRAALPQVMENIAAQALLRK